METKHTPGPWRVADAPMTSSGLAIFGSDPKWPHAIAIAKPAPAFDYVASVGEANAALIAAAPAMLAALQSIYTDDDGDGYVSAEGMDIIRAAIAQATGTPTAI